MSDLHHPEPNPELEGETSPQVQDEGTEPWSVHDVPGGVRAALEAILMVVEEPTTAVRLAACLEVTVAEVLDELEKVADRFEREARGFTLREVAGGWRIYSRADLAPAVQKFVMDGQTAKLTRPALETLAVVAYRQPVSRARISAVRGVAVDGVMRTLLTRGLIEESGTDEETGAMLYVTTTQFLERMGLASVDELPPLAPFLPDAALLDDLVAGTA